MVHLPDFMTSWQPIKRACIDIPISGISNEHLSPKSKSAEAAIDAATSVVRSHIYPMPPYLRYTPVGLSEEEKYDYGRSDLWDQIQYLPDALRNAHFYEPFFSSQYEKVLASNLDKLRKIKRSNNMPLLKKK